jgi:hypothetical protein
MRVGSNSIFPVIFLTPMTSTPSPVNLSKRKIQKSRFCHQIHLESYGVKIRISSNDSATIDAIAERLPMVLVNRYHLTSPVDADHKFYYVWNSSGRDSLYKEGSMVGIRREREGLLDQLGSYIRITVAEFAVDKVFLHAGVVSWKGKAIVMPAKSFEGKSTLTAELVRLGALYYSDEYAVLDKDGNVSPFPKMLSIRGGVDERAQTDYPVEAFGGKAGIEKIPVGMVLLTIFKPKAKWNPRILSSGKGVIEIIRNTVPIRNDPSFTLAVLNRLAQTAKIVKSPRGDASESAGRILEFFESVCL